MAAEAADINFYVSYTGILTFKSADKLRAAAAKIPLERVLLETDSPYMAPEPFRGKNSEAKHVLQIASKLAEIKGLSLEEISAATSANAEKLFGLHGD